MSHSFTVTSNGGLLRQLVTTCHVCEAFDPSAGQPEPPLHPFQALWDTGATGSVITQAVVDKCGLKPTGMTEVHGVHGPKIVPTFLVNIGLPNGVGVIAISATLAELKGCDVLIGMDVINHGDLAITNKNVNTVFTFRMPSKTCIDFVKEHAFFEAGKKQRSSDGFRGHPHQNRRKKNKRS